MLVLSRKPGEMVHVGTDVTLIVLGVEGGRVRLGIEAPAALGIVRGELVDGPPRHGPSSSPEGEPPAGRTSSTCVNRVESKTS